MMKTKQSLRLEGIYTITKAKIKNQEQWDLHNKIVKAMKEGLDYISLIRKFNKLCKAEIFIYKNIIPTVGRTLIANNLTNVAPTNNIRINYTALGTGNTAVANSDTTLDVESYRKQIASQTNSDNVGYATAFYSAAETSGTFKEAGLFCNASASVDSGVLFSRVLLNSGTGITKSVTETLTIEHTFTIT